VYKDRTMVHVHVPLGLGTTPFLGEQLSKKSKAPIIVFAFLPGLSHVRTGFAIETGYERTFSRIPKVIQVQWKLPTQKDFNVVIYGSFNQNRCSLLSNVSGDFGHKCRRLPTTR